MSTVRNRLTGEPPARHGSCIRHRELTPSSAKGTAAGGLGQFRNIGGLPAFHLSQSCGHQKLVHQLFSSPQFPGQKPGRVMITDTFLFRKPNCHQQETFRKRWITAAWGRCPRAAPGRPASDGGHQIKRRRPLRPAASDGLPVHNRNNAVPSPCQMFVMRHNHQRCGTRPPGRTKGPAPPRRSSGPGSR